jgi:hypothetical protein
VNLDNEIAQGNNAERVLTDVSPYLDMVETAILDTWKKSPVADEKGQHELRLMLKLLGDLKANLKNAIDNGKLAKVQIERENLIDKAKNVVRRFA